MTGYRATAVWTGTHLILWGNLAKVIHDPDYGNGKTKTPISTTGIQFGE